MLHLSQFYSFLFLACVLSISLYFASALSLPRLRPHFKFSSIIPLNTHFFCLHFESTITLYSASPLLALLFWCINCHTSPAAKQHFTFSSPNQLNCTISQRKHLSPLYPQFGASSYDHTAFYILVIQLGLAFLFSFLEQPLLLLCSLLFNCQLFHKAI